MPRVALSMERIRVRFEGRVQGVGFRATTQRLAHGRPVTGWVRNDPDGSVLMEVQGRAGDIEALLTEIARVMGRNIRNTVQEPLGVHEAERGFDVRR